VGPTIEKNRSVPLDPWSRGRHDSPLKWFHVGFSIINPWDAENPQLERRTKTKENGRELLAHGALLSVVFQTYF